MDREWRLLRCLTGFSLGIGLLVLLNQLRIPFYLYYPLTTHTVLISESYDLYLFLISSVCLPGTIVVLRKLSKSGSIGILAIWGAALALTVLDLPYGSTILYATIICSAILNVSDASPRRRAASEILTCTLPIFVLIESSPLYYWSGAALNPQTQTGFLSQQLELNLTYALFPLGIVMMLLLLFSWVPVVFPFSRQQPFAVQYSPSPYKWDARWVAVSLDLFAVVAILIFFYPYLAGQTWIVGVDSYWRYLDPLNALAGLAPSQALLTSALHGLYIGLLYLVRTLTGGSSFAIVKFAPLVLAFATASAVFLVIIRGGWNFELGVLSAICTLLWFPTTLGIYAGIQANWFAYLLWMLFLSFYSRKEDWNVIILILQGLISLAILLIHPWSWGVFVACLLITTLVSWRSAWKTRCIQGALAAIMIALPVGALAYEVLPSVRYDWADVTPLYMLPLFHPVSLLTFGDAIAELFINWGPFLPPLLLLLSLVGVYNLSGKRGIVRNYLVGWLVAWCIGSIMIAPSGFSAGNPGMSETGLWRMLYVSPLPILLALGFQKFLDLSKRLQGPDEYTSWKAYAIPVVLVGVSAGLFMFDNPLVRLVIVIGVDASLAVVGIRFPKYQVSRLLIASLLLLLLANAAFRSLYPLLLDPHSLILRGSG
jgi:hypothetical protein